MRAPHMLPGHLRLKPAVGALSALLTLSLAASAQAQLPEIPPLEDDEASEGRVVELAPPRLNPVFPVDEPEEPTVSLEGHYRLSADAYERPLTDGLRGGMYQQLRLGSTINLGAVEAVASADLLSGRLLGNAYPAPPPVGDHGARPFHRVLDGADQTLAMRELYLRWDSPVGRVQAGLQTSQWGLGLLANDGDIEDETLFGEQVGGDRVARLLFATSPFRGRASRGALDNLFVAVGADAVIRDENADINKGDRALQGIASVVWRPAPSEIGVYVALRDQTDRDGSELNVAAFDLAGKHQFYTPKGTWRFRIAGEAAYLRGETTRADGSDPTSPIQIDALGAAAHLDVLHRPSALGFNLRSGFASGDADPRSDNLHRFRFDPNYRAGLLLFDHHLPAYTAEAVAQADDPLRAAQPPRGIDNLVETGSVSNAIFVQPTLTFARIAGLELGAGALLAWAHRPWRDLAASVEAGGSVVGFRGTEASARYLGTEALLGARYTHLLTPELALEYRAEAAMFWPGSVFDDAQGRPDARTALVRAHITALW
ncbi:hypothetical protein EA187_09725 [Lujinxingia sediminis]|uniref:Alginate export domain-containing protein n=1 Tax=Lujinxingia sediminis TaxID=2480984 RepID=A0ABY0CU04_9DELT|nr:hypothetical protein [Lujinxingia sediminis]RVU44809.1 hypothetical protein EA187_09725 [Lujinxingia sediminis]